MKVHARLLGDCRIEIDGRVLADRAWKRSSAKNLFIRLLVAPRHKIPKKMIEEIFLLEDSSDRAKNESYRAIHALRETLTAFVGDKQGKDLLEVDRESISLSPSMSISTDVEELQSLFAAFHGHAFDESAVARGLGLLGGAFSAVDERLGFSIHINREVRAIAQSICEHALKIARLSANASEICVRVIKTLDWNTDQEWAYRFAAQAQIQLNDPNGAVKTIQHARDYFRSVIGTALSMETLRVESAAIALLQQRRATHQVAPCTSDAELHPIGREQLITDSIEKLLNANVGVALIGMPGIGKTAVCNSQRWCRA
jgi:hypothetical protein